MAAATIDTAYVSSYTTVPEENIQTLISQPTADLVVDFLQKLIGKAQEHEELKSKQLRLEVELENAVRGGDSRARTLKANADSALRDVETLRRKVNEEENARSSLEAQLQNLQASSSTSSTETQALQDQVVRLERSNRDTLSLLDSKSTAHDKLAEELQAQHQKTVSLRKDISALEEKNQTLDNSLSSAKFKESSLHQEIELLKRNNEWFESELKTKSAEFSKFRKDKNAKVAELQRLNEDATTNITSLQRTETTLRKHLEEINQKADERSAKIQQLNEDAARTEESFRAELDNSRRLVELQQQSAETARRRVQELENSLEETKVDAAEEISRAQAEVETERQAKESAEQRVEHLELQVERLETQVQQAASAPGTPRHLNETPGRAGSPATFTPGSVRSRGGLNFTQLYAELTSTKAELETERRRAEKYAQSIDQLMNDMEKKEPETQELQVEHARLQSEVTYLSTLLAKTGQEKDTAKKESRKWEGQVESLLREADLHRQQLRDHTAQIKVLLFEMQNRQDGVEPTAAERSELEQLAYGDEEGAFEGMTDSGRAISERLVKYKNIAELQDTNAKLLHLTRRLSEELEGEEAKAKRNEQVEEKQELERLRQRVDQYKDELKSAMTQSQSFIRERDMFRRMLSHRGKLPADADLPSMFGDSVNGGNASPRTPQLGRSVAEHDQSPHSKELADYSKLLREMQSHFDSYKQEAATDHSTLKGQVDTLAKEKGELQSELARANGQATLANERLDMLQSNYTLLKSENTDLQQRSQSLSEVAAKQDLRTQQVAEELIESKSQSESLRSENSNLKAEKELWKRIETRQTEDIQSLVEERTRLNKLITDSQNLHNERELSESETRRNLQNQVEALESEMRTVKRKLDEETEESKKATLRREYEQEQSRTRIDDLVKSLSNTKEELIAAKTTRDQLQARVEELKIDLRNAEERTQVLQPQPSSRPINPGQTEPSTTNENGLSKEQELGMEVADLKRDLEMANAELENARAQVAQYKAISQSTEEELQSLNESQDQYREETDKVIAEKDSKIQELEQRVDDISSELASTNTEISQLRTSADDANTRLDQQKTQYDAEITRIKDESERYMETAKLREEDVKYQAEIAERAQRIYDQEVMNHGEARKALQKVREEYNQVKLEVSESKAEAESARTSLAQNEESWAATKEHYERELTDLKTRRDDVDAQNNLLHKQLESVSSQINSLQQKRTSTGEDHEAPESSDSSMQTLQEVIKYLRREKEIVDVQYELSIQEGKRLRQQLDYTQTQLDDVRLKLDQERQRTSDSERSSMSHNKLVETINELNVFRESSVTLRNEARQAQSQLAEKSKQVEDLLVQIQPLQSSVREAEAEKENHEGEMKLLREDRDRWQQRTQNILQKYDRVDPEELENLKQQISTLQSEKDQAVTDKTELQTQSDNNAEKIRQEVAQTYETKRQSLIDQFKNRSKELSQRIKNTEAEAKAARDELDSIKKELEDVKTERDAAVARVETSAGSGAREGVSSADARMENGVEEEEEGQVDESGRGAQNEASVEQIQSLEAKILEESNRAEQLQTQVVSLETRVTELQQEIEARNAELDQLRSQTATAEASHSNEDTERLQEELVTAQKEIESLRNRVATAPPVVTDGTAPTNEEQIQALRTELENERDEKIKAAEAQYQQRADRMKGQLSTKLTEGKAAIREQLKQEHETSMQALRDEHETAINELKSQHEKDLEELRNAQPATTQPPSGEQSSSTAPPATENSFNADSTPVVKSEGLTSKAPEDWQPTDDQVRKLISTNQVARGILMRNIKSRVDQELTKAKEEHEKVLAEKEQTANKAKEQAVFMEGKKFTVKMNMAENRQKSAQAKIDVVEKAATETPQRPVVEVWEVAKNAKFAPAVQSQAQSQVQTPAAAAAKPNVPALQTQTSNTQQQQSQNVGSAGIKSPTPTSATPQAPQQSTPAIATPATEQSQTVPTAESQSTASAEPTQLLQQGARRLSSAGTGPGALRGLMGQGSAIPRGGALPRAAGRGGGGAKRTSSVSSDSGQAQAQAQAQVPSTPAQFPVTAQQQQGGQQAQTQGQANRGSGLPRGGSMRGRGNQQRGNRGGGGGASAADSPTQMNPSARQFVPGPSGNKRPREDSNGGDAGNKRPRGGGAGQ